MKISFEAPNTKLHTLSEVCASVSVCTCSFNGKNLAYQERLKMKHEDRPTAKSLIKNSGTKQSLSCLGAVKLIGCVYY